jgi:pimeloyl-ACP methyl ester carboxylesterase
MLTPLLPNSRVYAGLFRPLWQPEVEPSSVNSWETFAEDLIAVIDSEIQQPVIGVGHSMGAVSSLIAAVKRPDLFTSVVLIEPVLVPQRYLVFLRLFSRLSPRRIPMVRIALARKDSWHSHSEAFNHFRGKGVFKGIEDATLWDYILHGTKVSGDGSFTLTYSKAWEAHCYTMVYNLRKALATCQVPTLAIRGEQSNVVIPFAWKKWQKQRPDIEFVAIKDSGHLLPFEKPLEVSGQISRWITASQ